MAWASISEGAEAVRLLKLMIQWRERAILRPWSITGVNPTSWRPTYRRRRAGPARAGGTCTQVPPDGCIVFWIEEVLGFTSFEAKGSPPVTPAIPDDWPGLR